MQSLKEEKAAHRAWMMAKAARHDAAIAAMPARPIVYSDILFRIAALPDEDDCAED